MSPSSYRPAFPAVLLWFVFLLIWGIGPLWVPAALILVAFQRFELAVVLALYYIYRYFFPRRLWKWWHEGTVRFCERYQYCRTQRLIFDSAAGGSGSGIPPKSKSLLCWAPHGIFCVGWSLNGSVNRFGFDSQLTFLGTEALFYLPLIADYLSWFGTQSASPQNFKRLMQQGRNICLLPGGFQEATLFQHGEHRIYIKKRLGFIKYGLQYGYKIYPVYTFGEEQTYWQTSAFESFRLWLNEYKLPGIACIGKWFTILPNWDCELISVVGSPIQLPLIENPSKEEVKKWHSIYVEALVSLIEKHKDKYNNGKDAPVRIY